jgi:hypothetical protein
MRNGTIDIAGERFVDREGRHVILRGVNLGGDCKIPYPDGGTHLGGDFSTHRSVSFVGRPLLLEDADAHLARIARWGFNCLRLLVTWEAIAHEGPDCRDEAYLDYIATVARRAADHGLVLFIDMHQDVWSRMTGGDGAPGWIFEKVGLDFTRFHAAGAAHVMQYRYDYASADARQENRYPMMSWARNYRLPANGIMWTAFFAGHLLTPQWQVDGENVQSFLQRHYLDAMRAVAERLADNDAVIGFDTLNEPSPGFIGQAMSRPQLAASREAPIPVRAGPCWTPFTALRAAGGEPIDLPILTAGPDGAMRIAGSERVNPEGVSIWRPGMTDPFAAAGAWAQAARGAEVIDEEFFRRVDGRAIDPDTDLMRPFFHAVADTIRAVRPDWLLFAESNPYQFGHGRGFPSGMPARSVNASHWYDVEILWKKAFDARSGAAMLSARYRAELEQIHAAANLPGVPRLLGEFGIPYDLADGTAYVRWAAGNQDDSIWDAHVSALAPMYDAIDALLLSSTQWTYTASNSNDLRIGDGWNQEDLSIFSPDQLANGDGARARGGFSRPYVRCAQGTITAMQFDAATRQFVAEVAVDTTIGAPTEIFIPEAHYPRGIAVEVDRQAKWIFDAAARVLRVEAGASGSLQIIVVPDDGAE